MCGVIGLIYERSRSDLGRIASELLETLEYRGYDSTGAAIQDQDRITLLKGVGAPSVMVHELGIFGLPGQILCGQVRWATFGAVDRVNAQPHEVECKVHLYGAHNGNVTNCDDLKLWLGDEGHHVLSDNDGEMVVHTVEHYFALELADLAEAERRDHAARRKAMRAAIVRAAARLQGSYGAVIVDPQSKSLWAVKQGSSLYLGIGRDETGGAFTIASSDLSSVLKLTRVVVPMSEGDFVEYGAGSYQLYHVKDRASGKAGQPFERTPVRSRLRAKDTALLPQFESFMAQEISAQEGTCREVITTFLGGSAANAPLRAALLGCAPEKRNEVAAAIDRLRDEYDDAALARGFFALLETPAYRALRAAVPVELAPRGADRSLAQLADELVSPDAGFLVDLLPMAKDTEGRFAVRLFDVLVEQQEAEEHAASTHQFVELALDTRKKGGRIFVVCCGSSYHAAKAGSLFFNEMARAELVPVLPGEFRGQYGRTIRDGDLLVAVSQSGETKDLIDVIKDVIATGRAVRRVALVNNVSSTIGQELSDLVIPLRCGPEIAVPATKSFMNQMVVLYCLALKLGERSLESLPLGDSERAEMARNLSERRAKLGRLPELIRETVDGTAPEVEQAAQLLFLCPSLHILATRLTAIAKEGALKVREVVLNHSEGFEASEFKHGPNTILGQNTLYGPREIQALLARLGDDMERLLARSLSAGRDPRRLGPMAHALADSVLAGAAGTVGLADEERVLVEAVAGRAELFATLVSDYPLIYVTGPNERDVNLTVSQVNTHKIRGSITIMMAEEHPALRQAATKAPAGSSAYRSVYVTLPRTGDALLTMFSATVVLQRLALRMSTLKMSYLDKLGAVGHGVHPDVPKNVSKSITVD